MDADEKSAAAASSTPDRRSRYEGMPRNADAQVGEASGLQSMASLLGEGADGVSCSVDGNCD